MTNRPTKQQLRSKLERLLQSSANTDRNDVDQRLMGPLTERQEAHIETLLEGVNKRNPEGMAAVNEQLRRERDDVPPICERETDCEYVESELTTGELMLLDVLGSDTDGRRPGEALRNPPDDDIYLVAQEQTRKRDRQRDRKSTDSNN